MPHLPIEIEGGSVTIRFPVKEGAGSRMVQRDSLAADTIEAADGHDVVKLNRYSESDADAKICLIELKGTAQPDCIYYVPIDGKCLITIHYLNSEEVKRGEKAKLPAGAIPKPL